MLLLVATALAQPPQLVVLGIAQDAGHPQAGCTRTCCAAAWTDPDAGHRVSSLGLVDPDTGQHWLFDATPDLPRQLHALEQVTGDTQLAGVFLTHAHIGHYTGLMHLGREAMGARDVPVHVMPRMRAFVTGDAPWRLLVEQGHVALRGLTADTPVQLTPRLRVTPLLVPHRDELSETVGFVIEGPTRRALYLPDIDKWERWRTPVEDVVAGVDLAFVDATFFDADELPGRDMAEIPHPFVVETLARFAERPDLRARLRLIHLNHTNPLLRPGTAARARVDEAGLQVAVEGSITEL